MSMRVSCYPSLRLLASSFGEALLGAAGTTCWRSRPMESLWVIASGSRVERRLVACASSGFENPLFPFSGVELRWAHRPGGLCSGGYGPQVQHCVVTTCGFLINLSQ